ncbi:helix-turn-helix domain-containing protein [Cohnella lubricantis]
MTNETANGFGEQLFRQLKGVSGEKRQKLIEEINLSLGFDEPAIRERRHANRLRCPTCGTATSASIVCYGKAKPGSDRQRYLCKSCGAFFNDHTGTVLHRTKKLERWPLFLKYLLDGQSIRQIAKEAGISPTTAQAWRKKLLTHLAEKMSSTLSGIVEAVEISVKTSYKGKHKLYTPASKTRETLVFCKSRNGNVCVSHGSLQELKQSCKNSDILWHTHLIPATPISSAERRLLHTKQADAIAGHFANQYARMRGTATTNLPLYAAWHQFQHETRHFTQREKIRRLLFAGL